MHDFFLGEFCWNLPHDYFYFYYVVGNYNDLWVESVAHGRGIIIIVQEDPPRKWTKNCKIIKWSVLFKYVSLDVCCGIGG